MATYLPIVRIEYGKYLLGTHEKNILLQNNGAVVHTDDGWVKLEEYLKQVSKSECVELKLYLLLKSDGTFKNTVISLLK